MECEQVERSGVVSAVAAVESESIVAVYERYVSERGNKGERVQ